MASSVDPLINDKVQQMRRFVGEDHLYGWDKTWKAGVTPWESGSTTQPALRLLVESGELDLPREGRALVPGCGRGYDAIFLASSLGLDVLAIDISQTALEAANELLAASHAPRGKVKFEEANFLTFKVDDKDRFDIIYDYTFFVALLPSTRPQWGEKMNTLIRPGGYLITHAWPLDLPLTGGPPFHVDLEDYPAALGDGWTKVLDKVPEESIDDKHKGRERLLVWKKL